jgi:UPF0755 protein
MADRKSGRRRRRRNGLVEIANALLGLVVIGLLVVGGLLFYAAQRFYAEGPVKEPTTFVVERNSGLGVVAERLEDQGLIENRFIFQAGGYALKKQAALKAGEFNIAANASMANILKEITEGKPITYAVTIPEGFTAWQVMTRLTEEEFLTGEITTAPPEGSVLPETYNYDRGDTRDAVLERMQTAQQEILDEVWAGCDPEVCGANQPIKSPAELVTLASIVERETGVPTERPQVAAVFLNRLEKGMRLQSDPTIIYGITKGETTRSEGLKRSEIEQVNDYNTYQMDGLPKGPIANPGTDSLKAVAHPAATKDLYFVAAGPVPSDGHLFAESYAEHRRNVAKWRAIERQQANAAADTDADAAKDAIAEKEAAESGEDVPADEAPADPAPQ